MINTEIIAAKAMFLAYSDPFEKYRALLFEYAHTLGHGLEAFMNGLYRRASLRGLDFSEAFRLHGQCVGMAVLWAGEMSKQQGLLEGKGFLAHQALPPGGCHRSCLEFMLNTSYLKGKQPDFIDFSSEIGAKWLVLRRKRHENEAFRASKPGVEPSRYRLYTFNRFGGYDFGPLRRLCDALDVSRDEFCEGVLQVGPCQAFRAFLRAFSSSRSRFRACFAGFLDTKRLLDGLRMRCREVVRRDNKRGYCKCREAD